VLIVINNYFVIYEMQRNVQYDKLKFKYLSNSGPRLVFLQRRYWCQVSVDKRWQLTSCQFLLKIACQQVLLKGYKEMEITGPHTAKQPCYQLQRYCWQVMEHPHTAICNKHSLPHYPTHSWLYSPL